MEITNEFNTLRRLAQMHINLRTIKQYAESNRKSIQLRIENWVTPFGVLPLAVYANTLGLTITTGRNKRSVRSYLQRIYFPRGISDLNWIKSSSYLPISKLRIKTDDQYLTKYEDLIISKIKNKKIRFPFQNSLKYLTSEMITNINEHAMVDHYWIVAQYWPKTKTCEIAIADTGIGYKESYKGTAYEVENHIEAIMNAIQGNSSKDDIERGTGIPGMINIFCKGYGGCVVIMSGDTLLLIEKEQQDFYSLEVGWRGVFIGIRFKVSEINALEYLSGY